MNYWGPFRTFELGFVHNHLRSGEKVVYRTRLSRVLLAAPLTLLILAAILLPFAPVASLGILCLACAAATFLLPIYFVSELAVTTNRLLVQIFNHQIKVPLGDVQRVKVFQGRMGALFGYGTVALTWAAIPPQPIYLRWVSRPHELREHIEAGMATAAAAKTPKG